MTALLGCGRLADWYLHSVHAAVTASVATLYISQLGPVPDDIVPLVFANHDDAVQWLGSERLNYLAIIEHTATHGPVEYTWLLTDAARPDLHLIYWTDELERAATYGLKCARRVGNRRGEAVMLLALGALKSIMIPGRFDDSLADLFECRKVALEISETGIVATATLSLAGLYVEGGSPAEGIRAAGDALELVERGVEQGGRRKTAALQWLGRANYLAGRLDVAADVMRTARQRYSEQGPPVGEVAVGTYLGHIYREMAEFEKALQ